MRIKVLINYGGKDTRERRILPGEYDIDDPALFGVGRGLVERGQAVAIESEKPQETINKMIAPSQFETLTGDEDTDTYEPVSDVPTMDNLKSEIQAYLDLHGIEYAVNMTKNELLDLIPDDHYDWGA